MAARPEDRNARQMHDAFPGGATLAELEAYVAAVRAAGAPDDAHPTVTLNAENEIVFMVCVTRRHPEINEAIERNRAWAQDASGEPTVLRPGSVIEVRDPS